MMIETLRHPDALPLYDSAHSRLVEAAALSDEPPHALMERAGLAVAKLALAIAPRGGPIWIACGPGNNGGDGWVAARWLHAIGREVLVSTFDEGKPPPADAHEARRKAQEAGVRVLAGQDAAPGTELVVDALLGLGLSRAPSAALMAGITAIRRARQQGACVLAVDVPSGLDADHGSLPGDLAVRADQTLSLLTLKPGLFTARGREHAGRIWLDDLGVAPQQPHQAWLHGLQLNTPAPRGHSSHKGSQGDVLVIGGAPGMNGAAWLAASAALGAGTGRVHACLLDDSAPPLLPGRLELMHWDASRLAQVDAWQDLTLVCGCGGGAAVQRWLPTLLQHARRLVLDADALNAITADPALQAILIERSARAMATVLTPHPLEAARLAQFSHANDVQRDRLACAQELAERFQCVVTLKGSGTICAAPGRIPIINKTGTGALATAGTGDVLAGWLGGLWAQSPEAELQALTAQAVAWHGLAASQFSARRGGPLLAMDLIQSLRGLHP